MTLLKDNNYKEINVALLSLEADIKNKIAGFDTSAIDKQLAEINSRIDKINAGGGNNSSEEIEDINSKLNSNSNKIRNLEQNIGDIDTRIDGIEQKLSDIFSAENKVTDFNATTNSGIYYWVTDAANRPTDYGVLLVNKYDGGSSTTSLWVNQIAYGTNNKIYFRQNINNGNWTEWKAVAFEGEINNATLTVNGKTYNGSEAVDAGVQTVANGGTGVTTQADINRAFIGNLDTGESDVTDGTEFVSSWASDNGFAETAEAVNTPYKRQFVKVWNYIKGKISSVLGLTANNYGDIQIGSGNTTGNKLTIRGLCVSSNSYTDANPKLVFMDDDGSQNISLTFTDFDAVQAPASLTLNGNQGNEYFIAPNIKVNRNITLDSSNGASPSAYGTEPLTIGFPSGTGDGQSLGFDRNSMQVRTNGEASTMYLNFYGGMVKVNETGQSNGGLKVNQKMVIPIGAPSSLEDGCIWIER